MKFDKKKFWVIVLALLGLGLSIKLAHIYYVANFDKYALSSFCSINDFVDCDGAARTTKSQFCGIPLAYWGIFFYLIILFLSFVDKLKQIRFLSFLEVFKTPMAYISSLGLVSFFISMSLAIESVYVIKKLCILCVATYFINLFIALVAAGGSLKTIVSNFKVTFFDFIDGVKKYTKTFIVLLLLFAGFMTYSGVTLNFVPHIKHSKSILKYRKIKVNPYRIKGNLLGVENADVIIELYSDYVCPLCYINNIMLHQAVKEFKNIKVVHHNLPFDKECNPYIEINMHPNACFMSKAAIASRNQENYWEMSSLLYEKQPKNIKAVLELVDQLNFDKDKFIEDLNSENASIEIQEELKKSDELGLDATPTMFINGEKIVGVKPYYELQNILIKHGAKRK